MGHTNTLRPGRKPSRKPKRTRWLRVRLLDSEATRLDKLVEMGVPLSKYVRDCLFDPKNAAHLLAARHHPTYRQAVIQLVRILKLLEILDQQNQRAADRGQALDGAEQQRMLRIVKKLCQELLRSDSMPNHTSPEPDNHDL